MDDAVPVFKSLSLEMNQRFAMAGDLMHNSALYVAGLLERGVRVLIYVGEYYAQRARRGRRRLSEVH